jgi:hypothetical protein
VASGAGGCALATSAQNEATSRPTIVTGTVALLRGMRHYSGRVPVSSSVSDA